MTHSGGGLLPKPSKHLNKLINGKYDDHHCDHAVAEINIYDDDVDDVDQIRGGGKQVD